MRLCRTLGHIERFRDQLVGFRFGNQREDIAVAARQLSPRCMLDKWLVVVLIAVQAIAAYAVAGERAGSRQASLVPGKPTHSSRSAGKDHRFTAAPLDRVASAVDGAESSHGRDAAMWRPDPSGPQGPMQVSEAAAIDAGGGDRFDLLQNRAIGRAYLLQLFWRYGNWPDAIAAYNWGIGKMDAWLKAGRPPAKFLVGVAAYLRRVLHESGLCEGLETGPPRQSAEDARDPASLAPVSVGSAACVEPGPWARPSGVDGGPTAFSRKLDGALQLALQRAALAR
jgi:transglycosylase-like protein with SLT domain